MIEVRERPRPNSRLLIRMTFVDIRGVYDDAKVMNRIQASGVMAKEEKEEEEDDGCEWRRDRSVWCANVLT